MAKYRVTRSRAQRVAEQKAQGVEDGDIKQGAKGRTARRWNEKKGRWEKVSVVLKRGKVAFDTKRGAGVKGKRRPPGDYQTGQGMTATDTPPRKMSTIKSGYQTGANQTTRKRGSGSSAAESRFAGRRDPGKGYQTGSGVYKKVTDKKKAADEAAYLRAQAKKAGKKDKETFAQVIDTKDQIPEGQIKITKSGNLESKFRWSKKKNTYILTHRRRKGDKNWRLV